MLVQTCNVFAELDAVVDPMLSPGELNKLLFLLSMQVFYCTNYQRKFLVKASIAIAS